MSASAGLVTLAAMRGGERWAAWRALAGGAPPFLSPEFVVASRRLAPAGDAFVACAQNGAGMIGALPLVLAGETLRALRCDHTPEYDFVGGEDGLDAIWRALRGDRRWSMLTLLNVPARSLLATRLPELARADGCPVRVRAGVRHPAFPLAGFEGRLSSKFRSNLQRCARKAGGIELERIETPTHAAFDEALAIEALAWKGAAGTSIAGDPEVDHFYRVVMRLYGAHHRAALCFLRADGRRVATMLSVEDASTLYALKIGYDPAAAAYSPGHLLVWLVAADAERRGLATFDFVGREDEWKRKWTDEGREHVHVLIYRRSPKGLARYAAHELIKPRVAEVVPDLRHPLRRGCQRDDLVGVHTPLEQVRGRIARGLGLRPLLRRAMGREKTTEPVGLGTASRFAPGAWVRVADPQVVRATLDDRSKLRGLEFVPAQWETCGQVFRVSRAVQRIRDDHGRPRAITGTVLLDGPTCAGHGDAPQGCGRHCPLMYRDEWLQPAEAPVRAPAPARAELHARVRTVDEIVAGLDLHGRRDGLSFHPAMEAFCGKRYPIANRLTEVFELDRWVPTRAPVYLLDGPRCDGSMLAAAGPCHRACALLWHEDWLVL